MGRTVPEEEDGHGVTPDGVAHAGHDPPNHLLHGYVGGHRFVECQQQRHALLFAAQFELGREEAILDRFPPGGVVDLQGKERDSISRRIGHAQLVCVHGACHGQDCSTWRVDDAKVFKDASAGLATCADASAAKSTSTAESKPIANATHFHSAFMSSSCSLC